MAEQTGDELLSRVVVDPTIRGGRPVIRGTRVLIARTVGAPSAGATPQELVEDYGLQEEDIKAALADEDLPRAVADLLRARGYDADHVLGIGLRSAPDEAILREAQEQYSILLTADLDFANVRKHPPGSHCGIIVLRFPDYFRRARVSGGSPDQYGVRCGAPLCFPAAGLTCDTRLRLRAMAKRL